MTDSKVMIYRGHSSISLKDGSTLQDITNISELKDATTFILPEGYNIITMHPYGKSTYANTTEYFILWGLQDSNLKDKILKLLKKNDPVDRNKCKNEILKKMTQNFLIKLLNTIKTYNEHDFKMKLLLYFNMSTVDFIWDERLKHVASQQPELQQPELQQPELQQPELQPGNSMVLLDNKMGGAIATVKSDEELKTGSLDAFFAKKKKKKKKKKFKPFNLNLMKEQQVITPPTVISVVKPEVADPWKEGSYRRQQLNAAIKHDYINDEIIEKIMNDINFRINVYRSGDLVNILSLDCKLIFDKKDVTKTTYHHGFFILNEYLKLHSPLAIENITYPEEIQMENIHERMEKIREQIEKSGSTPKLNAELSKLNQNWLRNYEIVVEKKKVGLSDFNITHDIPRFLSFKPKGDLIRSKKELDDTKYFLSTIVDIYQDIKNGKTRDIRLYIRRMTFSDNIVNINQILDITDILFNQPLEDIITIGSYINRLPLFLQLREINIIPEINPNNLNDIFYELDSYFNNFFNYMDPKTYIFASCGSFDEEIEDRIKTFASSSTELDTMLERINEEGQLKVYQKKYFIKY
jgi:hypothetical protein